MSTENGKVKCLTCYNAGSQCAHCKTCQPFFDILMKKTESCEVLVEREQEKENEEVVEEIQQDNNDEGVERKKQTNYTISISVDSTEKPSVSFFVK